MRNERWYLATRYFKVWIWFTCINKKLNDTSVQIMSIANWDKKREVKITSLSTHSQLIEIELQCSHHGKEDLKNNTQNYLCRPANLSKLPNRSTMAYHHKLSMPEGTRHDRSSVDHSGSSPMKKFRSHFFSWNHIKHQVKAPSAEDTT